MTQKIGWSVFVCLLVCGSATAQQARFDDVVRNLRNPDPKIRLSALRLLRESKYPEAAGPVAALVTDPVDQVQLEAIAAELSFFLAQDIPDKRRVALLVEKRNQAPARTAFEAGPLAVWPHPVPPELVQSLLQAVDDGNKRVRVEALYTLGTIARPPLADSATTQLIKALDHYDPVIRAAAADVIGRLQVKTAGEQLINALNDSKAEVRYAAMRALGTTHEKRAVAALTEQFNYYGKGEGASSALNALAQIADPSSVPLFKPRLRDPDPLIRRAAAEGLGRAGDRSELSELQMGAGSDPSSLVRDAMCFALQKLGQNYVARLADSLRFPKLAAATSEYLIELGPSVVPSLLPLLKDPSPELRASVAQVIGALGSVESASALQPLAQDHDPDVVQAATRALERLKAPRQ
jgi:HEAT repeat protein